MQTPDAYRCDHCGAEYEPSEFYEFCHSDGLGNLEFRCSCGCHDYTELFECKFCHYLESPYKNRHLEYYGICNDCLGAVANEYNSALDGIAEDYRKILERVFDIRKIDINEEV